MAVLHAKGQLAIGQDFVHESIIGSVFTRRLPEATTLGRQPAVRRPSSAPAGSPASRTT